MCVVLHVCLYVCECAPGCANVRVCMTECVCKRVCLYMSVFFIMYPFVLLKVAAECSFKALEHLIHVGPLHASAASSYITQQYNIIS